MYSVAFELACEYIVSTMERTWRDVIRALLFQRDWTQDRLAREAGMTPSRLSDIVNGRREPSLDYLGRLGGALGLPISELLAMREGKGLLGLLEDSEGDDKGASDYVEGDGDASSWEVRCEELELENCYLRRLLEVFVSRSLIDGGAAAVVEGKGIELDRLRKLFQVWGSVNEASDHPVERD